MQHGVPFDVAFSLDEITRTAYAIIFSEHEGREFDWARMQFKEPA